MFGEKKRTFKELQKLILIALRAEKLTKHQISKKTGIRWEVIDHQLITLKGLDYVRVFYVHQKMKIYEITPEGILHVKKNK